MPRNQSKVSASGSITALLAIINVILLREAYVGDSGWLVWPIALPLLLLAIYKRIQKKPEPAERQKHSFLN